MAAIENTNAQRDSSSDNGAAATHTAFINQLRTLSAEDTRNIAPVQSSIAGLPALTLDNYTVSKNDSVYKIATDALPGASASDIAAAAKVIETVNHLSSKGVIHANQHLYIPKEITAPPAQQNPAGAPADGAAPANQPGTPGGDISRLPGDVLAIPFDAVGSAAKGAVDWSQSGRNHVVDGWNTGNAAEVIGGVIETGVEGIAGAAAGLVVGTVQGAWDTLKDAVSILPDAYNHSWM